MAGQVKGTLFVDYVRMLRAQKDTDWSKVLPPGDLQYLISRIEPDRWYPMETFERMGLAILAQVAGGSLEAVQAWGRAQAEWLSAAQPALISPGDARETLMRFEVLRNSFFDDRAVEISEVSDGDAAIRVRYGMGAVAEEAASVQTLGFFERLVELAGGSEVKGWFSSSSWQAGPDTIICLRWSDVRGAAAGGPSAS